MKQLYDATTKKTREGFTLPVILIVSMALLTIGLSLMQNSSSIADSLNDQYYNRISQEAAEAGIAYANFCLRDNGYQQTWGPTNSKPNLTQSTDCFGNEISTAPDYLMENGLVHTSFSVGNLKVREDGAIILDVSGSNKRIAGSTVLRTVTTGRNEVVKWKKYKASVSASGTYKTCAIVTNELYCWGINSNNKNFDGGSLGGEDFSGQLGDGTTTNSLVPVKVVQDTGLLKGKVVDDVVSEQFHNCALAQGSVYCWGKNQYGQLGNGTNTDSTVPVKVGGLLEGKVVTAIGGATDVGCAIANSKIYCWGRNDKGQLGIGSKTNKNTPTEISTTNFGTPYTPSVLSTSGSRAKSICAVINTKAYCWGANEIGQLGDNTTSDQTVPTKVYDSGVLSGKSILAISQDGYYAGGPYPHVCVLASDQKAYCWGKNSYGQLGDGTRTDRKVPVAVRTNPGDALYGKTVQDIVVGIGHSCALADSKVYCWGGNGNGQLGDGTNTNRTLPVSIYMGGDLSGKTITAIGGGSNRGCAVADLTNYCWGKNSEGQLGDGTQTNRKVPTKSIFLDPKAPTYIF